MLRIRIPPNISCASLFYIGRLFISSVKPRAFKPTFKVKQSGGTTTLARKWERTEFVSSCGRTIEPKIASAHSKDRGLKAFRGSLYRRFVAARSNRRGEIRFDRGEFLRGRRRGRQESEPSPLEVRIEMIGDQSHISS
jgi:hypothetical protein